MTSPNIRRHSVRYFQALAFVGGFDIMLLEMCAFRTIGTTFGSSVYVTGTLLALVMVSLAAGYYAGGRLSARAATAHPLVLSLLGAVVYVNVCDVLFGHRLLDFGFGLLTRHHEYQGGPWNIPFGFAGMTYALPAGVVVLALYGAPMIALSQITPFLVKALSAQEAESAREVGVTAGRLMAISTAGSIVGTVLPSFALIPTLGVKHTLLVFSASILLASLWGVALQRSRSVGTVVATVAAIASMAAFWPSHGTATYDAQYGELVYEGESAYGTQRLYRHTSAETGEHTLIYMPSRMYVHGMIDPDHPLRAQFSLAEWSLGIPFGARDYLVLGLGNGSDALQLRAFDPTLSVTAVDIDPASIALTERYFGVKPGPNMRLFADDARLFIGQERAVHDYIFVDLFAGDHIPAQCVSREFFEMVRARLSPHGMISINTNLSRFEWSFEDRDPPKPITRLEATLKRAGFKSIYTEYLPVDNGFVFAFKDDVGYERMLEVLLAGMENESLPVPIRANLGLAYLGIYPVGEDLAQVRPFSDDWVPTPDIQRDGMGRGFEERILALANSPERGKERERASDSGDRTLRLLTTRVVADRYAQDPTALYTPLPWSYCQDVEEWLVAQPSFPLVPLAKYFWFMSCRGGESGAVDDARRTAFRRYAHIVESVSDPDQTLEQGLTIAKVDFVELVDTVRSIARLRAGVR